MKRWTIFASHPSVRGGCSLGQRRAKKRLSHRASGWRQARPGPAASAAGTAPAAVGTCSSIRVIRPRSRVARPLLSARRKQPADMHPDRRSLDASRQPVDSVVLAGVGLAAGGLAVVAPGEVATAAALVLAIAFRGGAGTVCGGRGRGGRDRRRARCAAARASTATSASVHGRTLIVPLPARCSARARVESSPVRVRGAVRWDGWLARRATARSGAWSGRATIYGGPEELARGDEVDIVATLAPPQRLWNAAGGRSASGRGASRGRAHGRRARRAGREASVRPRSRGSTDVAPGSGAASTPPSMPWWARWPGRSCSARAISRPTTTAPSGPAGSRTCSPSPGCTSCSSSRWRYTSSRARSAASSESPRGSTWAASRPRLGVPIAWVYAEFAGAGGLDAPGGLDGDGGARSARSRPARRRDASLRPLDRRDGRGRPAGRVRFVLSPSRRAPPPGCSSSPDRSARPRGAGRGRRAAPGRRGEGARAIGTTVAASVPCAPILARFAPTVPIGGVVANLVAVPLGESAALPLCLVHAPAGEAGPSAERGCAAVATGALYLVRAIARGFAVPSLTAQVPQPTSWQLVAHRRDPRRRRAPAAAARRARDARPAGHVRCSRSGARRAGAPVGHLRATFLDVGQGTRRSSTSPTARRSSVDGGGLVGSPIDVGTRVLAPELRARRRSALAAAVLTHPHPDHFGGLATGLDAVARGEPVGHRPGGARAGGRRVRRRSSRRCGLEACRFSGPSALRRPVWAACGSRCSRLARVPRPIGTRTTTRWSSASPTESARCSSSGDAQREEEDELLARAPAAPAGRCAQGRPSRERDVLVARVPGGGRASRGHHLGRAAQSLRAPSSADPLQPREPGVARLAHGPGRGGDGHDRRHDARGGGRGPLSDRLRPRRDAARAKDEIEGPMTERLLTLLSAEQIAARVRELGAEDHARVRGQDARARVRAQGQLRLRGRPRARDRPARAHRLSRRPLVRRGHRDERRRPDHPRPLAPSRARARAARRGHRRHRADHRLPDRPAAHARPGERHASARSCTSRRAHGSR